LRKLQLDLTEVDYARKPLDAATVEHIVARAGGVAAVLNTRHAVAKAKGWADQPPDAATFAKAVAAEPNLLRRPIVIAGKQVIVGLDRAAYDKLTG
jgi:arsenate reductase-like glutaredoxin family protein